MKRARKRPLAEGGRWIDVSLAVCFGAHSSSTGFGRQYQFADFTDN
jgi:hypothetical protein